MITISIMSFPPESAKEVGRRFTELAPVPSYIETNGPYLYTDERDGNTSITIYKYEKARAAEALDAISNLYVPFYGVPGMKYALKLASSSNTALSMLGLG